MRPIIAAFLSLAALAALPAAAADEPERVYGRFHSAVVAGDPDDALVEATAELKREITGQSAAQKDAAMKMLAASMPRAYVIKQKSIAPNGATARLIVASAGASLLDARSATLSGSIRMVLENGAWKVAAADWTGLPKESAAPAVQKPAPAQKAAAPAPAIVRKPGEAPRGGALVGATNAPPERKLGQAKEPCVYKAVMTAEDVENCK